MKAMPYSDSSRKTVSEFIETEKKLLNFWRVPRFTIGGIDSKSAKKLYRKSGMNENAGSASSIEQSFFYNMHSLVFHPTLILGRTIVEKCLYISASLLQK
jgi:hypothetical protein